MIEAEKASFGFFPLLYQFMETSPLGYAGAS